MKVNKYNKCSGGGGGGSYDEGYSQGKSDGVNEQKSKLESISITENGIYSKEDGYNHIEVNVPDLNGSYDEGKIDGVNEQKSKLVSINITENGTYTKEDGYNQIEVNVNAIPKINVQEAGLNFAYSTFTEVPEWADFYGVTNMERMFQNCYKLQTIPPLDTSNVADMSSMFHNCSNLQTIPQIDTSNVINMTNMFFSCSNLQTIPAIDTSNVEDMSSMFAYCGNLKTLPELDVSKVTNISNYFRSCGSNLTDVGGWKNLKINWNDNNGLARCPNLTYQSCINILNGLYDFVGNGSTETRTLKVHANFLTTVGNEISIGTNKGWTITA